MSSVYSGKSIHALLRQIAPMPRELQLTFIDQEILDVSNFLMRETDDKDAKYCLRTLTDIRDTLAKKVQK